MLCDQVAILRKGKVVVRGALKDLLKSDTKRTDVVIADPEARMEAAFEARGLVHRRLRDRVVVELEGEARVNEVLALSIELGCEVKEVTPRHETLEALFVREAIEDTAASSVSVADAE